MPKLSLKTAILDLFFPVLCLGCGRAGEYLCSGCLGQISRPKRKFADFLEPNFLDGVAVAADYDDPLLRQALHCFKYKFIPSLGGDLAKLFKEEDIKLWRDCLYLPLPLDKKRMRFREFNQAEILTAKLAERFNLKIASNVLKRIKHAVPQMSLGRAERLENVKDIFQVFGPVLSEDVVVVDDVLTTSATLNEAARVLKSAGARRVFGLVLAHGN